MKKFNFTIFTPLHNGAKTIHRVFNSLKNSTYSNFEWIVVNDGSTDDSLAVLLSLINSVDWDVKVINFEENRGKHVAWNEAAKLAKGEIFIVVDCDDAFVPNALSFFNEKWNDYFYDKEISSVNALCVEERSNKISGTEYPYDGIISTFCDLYNIYKVRGDKWSAFRTEYIKMFPFPEIKANYYTECYLHYSLAEKFSVVGYNEKLHKYYYEADSITHTRTIMRDNLYMIIHYQKWHIPRVASLLIKNNIRELGRCIKELVLTSIRYSFMRVCNIKEITYDS